MRGMRSRLIGVLLIVAALGCGEGRVPVTDVEPIPGGIVEHSEFVDAGLEGAVRSALKRPQGALGAAELLDLHELDGAGRKIADLEGIGRLGNLQRLFLSDNDISDLSPLVDLEQLLVLELPQKNLFSRTHFLLC